MLQDDVWTGTIMIILVGIAVIAGFFAIFRDPIAQSFNNETQAIPVFETTIIEAQGMPCLVLLGASTNKGEVLGITCDWASRGQ